MEINQTNTAIDMAHKYAEEHQKATVTLPEEFKEHAALFSNKEAKAFSPAWEWDHKIKLTKDAPASFNMKIYPMSKEEQEEEDKFLDENLAKGYIVPSDSSYGFLTFMCRNLREMGSRCGHMALKVLSGCTWAKPAVSTHCKGDKSSTFILHASGTLPFECIWYWHVPVHLISSPGLSQPSFPIRSTCPWAQTSASVNGRSTLMQPLWPSVFTSLAFPYHVCHCHSISKCSWCSLTLSNWYNHLSSSSHMVESLNSAPPTFIWL